MRRTASAAANLVSVGLANGGQVLAQYSDGQQVVVGQMAMADIRNPDSLIAAGNNNYQASALTALPAIGLPGTGGRGTVLGGSVEASTVDIATEFTNLIIYQRGYEANAHVITTADQLSQDTINLKQRTKHDGPRRNRAPGRHPHRGAGRAGPHHHDDRRDSGARRREA